MDIPRIISKIYESTCCKECKNHWHVAVCHGVTFVKYMGIDMKSVDTCRIWWRSRWAYIAHFIDLLGMKIKTVVHMTYFRREHMPPTMWRYKYNNHNYSRRWYNHHLNYNMYHHHRCGLYHSNRNNSSCHSHSITRCRWLYSSNNMFRKCIMFNDSWIPCLSE